MTERKYRMYGLVPYNISPIQQGIQYGHAVVEYANEFSGDSDYSAWAKNDKTFIILNGGTTNINTPGTLNVHEMNLYHRGIKHACFYEPDLGDQLTAVVFLADERVWDKESWPDYVVPIEDMPLFLRRKKAGELPENIIRDLTSWKEWKESFSDEEEISDKIVFLRGLLSKLRLA